MYRRFLQVLSAVCLLSTFWPALRFHNVTYFDYLAPITIICALPYMPKARGASLGSFGLALFGIAVLSLAGIISVAASFDSYEHILKVLYLVVALAAVVGLGYVLVNRQILTVVAALTMLCLSAMASSVVCIVQGKFGILTSLVPDTPPGGVQAWIRMTGLAGHPIEAGIISSFGIAIALGLAMHTRKWPLFLAAIIVNLFSFQYSASLTALFAVTFASAVMCLYAKAYRTLALGVIIVISGLALAFSFSSDAHLLTNRLQILSKSGGNYGTVRTREMQWSKSIDMIEPSTLLIGNGYSTVDLPYDLEIHNGIIASVFHFGLFGLLSQCLLIAFFAVRLRHDGPRTLRNILLGCSIIFLFAYMTGPALSRRSLWVPPIILGAYLITRKDTTTSRLSQTIDRVDLQLYESSSR